MAVKKENTMSKFQTALLTLAVISSLLTSALLFYSVFVVVPLISDENKHLALMEACTHQRLYLTQEITQSFAPFRAKSTKEEVAVINEVLSQTTNYLHSQEFYESCYKKTQKEWFLKE